MLAPSLFGLECADLKFCRFARQISVSVEVSIFMRYMAYFSIVCGISVLLFIKKPTFLFVYRKSFLLFIEKFV